MPESQTALLEALAWDIDGIEPDITIHANVEIREVGLAAEGAHVTHVRMLPGSRIVGTVHPHEHELVFVRKGRVTADISGTLVKGRPGTIFNIPRGVIHGYLPERSDQVVELLAIYAPDGEDT
jgi:quercetin dioxygenase-like cupin family protein